MSLSRSIETTKLLAVGGSFAKNVVSRGFVGAFEKLFGEKKYGDSRFGRYEIVRPGRVSPLRGVPVGIQCPLYAKSGIPPLEKPGIDLKSDKDLDKMRWAGELARKVLNKAGSYIQPGVTTDEIDVIVHEETVNNGAYPSPLNYRFFPKSCCISVNNVACHGIPDDRPLVDGDVVSVDVTVYLDGFHGDCAETFVVGDVDEQGRKLVDVARECRDSAIAACGPGVPVAVIGETVEMIVDRNRLAVLPMFAGHGIGTYFHGSPEILHFRNDAKQLMREGMTFTVEPCVGQGTDCISILPDNWTAVTKDDSRVAQFVHTIVITPHGAEILTPY